ncbi:MAG: glycosyltransferase family 4 protein [Syntrophales bacterium LBB04]|nr:glycosyltransferase family 4 protein [Syntrophales bacterium LBB04]
MRVWILTIGEPLPVSSKTNDRQHRTGILAQILAANGWQVTWWSSTFDHFRKYFYYQHDETVIINDSFKIIMLHGGGYRSNVSLARIRDQRRIAAKFSLLAPGQPRPDIILCSYPPIELSLAAVRFGNKYQVPVVLDMRDMWPDILVDHMPRLLRPVAKLAAAPMYRDAAQACSGATAITGITKAFVDWGLARGKRQRSELDKAFPMGYVSQPPADKQITEAESFWDSVGIGRNSPDFTICFIGTIGRQFDLESVIGAARKISCSGRQIRFVICGTGDRREYYQSAAADLQNLSFPGWMDAAKIFVLMRRSAVGLDPLPDRYDFLATINNKAIEYLSAGLPVISSPDHGVLSELLQEHQCGESYPHGDPEALVALLGRLYDDRAKLRMMSQNALRLFQENFTAEKVYGEMMAHLLLIAENAKQNQTIGSAVRKSGAR